MAPQTVPVPLGGDGLRCHEPPSRHAHEPPSSQQRPGSYGPNAQVPPNETMPDGSTGPLRSTSMRSTLRRTS